jgi:hypothetical protein
MSILRQRYQQKSILYLLRRAPDFDSPLPAAIFARYLALSDRVALNHGTALLTALQKETRRTSIWPPRSYFEPPTFIPE